MSAGPRQRSPPRRPTVRQTILNHLAKIEDVLVQLKEKMTIILVTNLIQQAQRISDDMMFLNDSDIVELGPTAEMFANPKQTLTEKYLAGEMG